MKSTVHNTDFEGNAVVYGVVVHRMGEHEVHPCLETGLSVTPDSSSPQREPSRWLETNVPPRLERNPICTSNQTLKREGNTP